jgi:hypothetical protein
MVCGDVLGYSFRGVVDCVAELIAHLGRETVD